MNFRIYKLMHQKALYAALFLMLLVAISILIFIFIDTEQKKHINEIPNCNGCNIIIISLTNTRKDHLSIYGYEKDTTPHIDEFFKSSLIFENTFSPTSWTLPNAVSLFTSLFPRTHGVIDRYGDKKVPQYQQTLAEILKANNYKTAAFTGGGDYSRFYGLDKGFDEYNDHKNFSSISDSIDNIINWLHQNKNKKFFLFVQGFDVHCPFNPPSPYNKKYSTSESELDPAVCYWNISTDNTGISGNQKKYKVYKQQGNDGPVEIFLDENDVKKLVNLYDGEINYADESLGRLFENIKDLKLDKNTLIVFLSEHGDLLGEGGRIMRTDIRDTFSDKVLNIPLLIKHPKISEPQKINGLVQLIDIMPTLLFFLDIQPNNSTFEGKNVAGLLSDNKGEVNQYVFANMIYQGSKDHPFFNDAYEVSMVRDLSYKLIHETVRGLEDNKIKTEKYKFYTINKDPNESKNLYNDDMFFEEINIFKDKLKVWKTNK